MPFAIGAVVLFSILVFFVIHYAQEQTSNPGPILKDDDYTGANSLRIMGTGATIASLTFTINVITQEN